MSNYVAVVHRTIFSWDALAHSRKRSGPGAMWFVLGQTKGNPPGMEEFFCIRDEAEDFYWDETHCQADLELFNAMLNEAIRHFIWGVTLLFL